MRIAILDSTGGMGQCVLDYLARNEEWSIHALSRDPQAHHDKETRKNVLHNFIEHLMFPIQTIANSYDYIINCYEVWDMERDFASINKAMSININLPTYLAEHPISSRVIHLTTPAVFSVQTFMNGPTESSEHDGSTVYGKSKSLGEVDSRKVVNIRLEAAGENKELFAKICERIIKGDSPIPNRLHIPIKYLKTEFPKLVQQLTE